MTAPATSFTGRAGSGSFPAPRFWAACALFWTLFGVGSATQIFVRETDSGATLHPLDVFNIVYFYWAWALVTPLALRGGEALLADGRPLASRIAAQLPWFVLTLLGQAALYALFSRIDGRLGADGSIAGPLRTLQRHLAGNVLTYVGVLGAYGLYRQQRRSREGERRAAEAMLRTTELESQLAQARLHALRAQLQPHFLFNTLNLVSGLVVRGEPVAANRALARLGELLRESLSLTPEQEIPLGRELAMTRTLLEIASLRMGDRLRIVERVMPGLEQALVPAMLLQPLVENAIEHGVGARARGGVLTILADLEPGTVGARLVLAVHDDGPGFGSSPLHDGVGLRNIRERLRCLHGDAASLSVADRDGGGAAVTVTLPLRHAGEPAGDRLAAGTSRVGTMIR